MRPRSTPTAGAAPTALVAADPAALLPEPGAVEDPVLRVLLERAAAGSTPRRRTDDHVVCLAVEGGGMRGAVSAGMCLVLEAAGLVPAFDRIYGVSAGALNAAATATGQASLSATHYQDAASRRVVNRMRTVVRRPMIDLDLLFRDVIGARKPLAFERLAAGPEVRALAVSLETRSLRVLRGFADGDELLQAIHASAALPRLAGEAPVFRGERMTDGGLLEAIPYEAALREGATHVLVLRTRSAAYRKPAYLQLAETLALREHPELADLLRERPDRYNGQAEDLERRTRDGGEAAHVTQIAVGDQTRLIGRLERNGPRVVEALRCGAAAMAEAILTAPVDLCWQPVVYRTARAAITASAPAGGSGAPAHRGAAARLREWRRPAAADATS